MKIYDLKNQKEEVVGYIEVVGNEIIVYNQCFINKFSNMYDVMLYVASNKLNLIPTKE